MDPGYRLSYCFRVIFRVIWIGSDSRFVHRCELFPGELRGAGLFAILRHFTSRERYQLAVALHSFEPGEVVLLVRLHRAEGLLDHGDSFASHLCKPRLVRSESLGDEELRLSRRDPLLVARTRIPTRKRAAQANLGKIIIANSTES